MLKKVYHSEEGKLVLVFLLAMSWIFYGSAQNFYDIVPDTVRSCDVDSLKVTANPDYSSIVWDNGDTTQYTWIHESGDYSVSGERNGLVEEKEFYVYFLPAQILEEESSINCGDTIVLHGSDYYYDYFWTPQEISGDSVLAYPRSTSNIFAVITNPDTTWKYCLDSSFVNVNQIIQVDSMIQSVIGCPDDSVAQAQAIVSGGFTPYTYEWPPEATALLEDPSYAFGLVDGDKTITITDSINCVIEHPFVIKAHRLPDLELYTDPTDTVYLQNPWVTFTYENPTYDSLLVDTFLVDNQWWDFGDSTEVSNTFSPTYAYQKVGPKTIVLTFKTYLGCYGTDTTEIDVLPVNIIASAVITPNDDEWNQYFELFEDTGSGQNDDPDLKSSSDEPIDLSKYYLSNTLVIFNRWGQKVHEVDNYNNDWEGGGHIDGTYFYVIKCTGEYRTDVFKGSFMILGSGGTQ